MPNKMSDVLMVDDNPVLLSLLSERLTGFMPKAQAALAGYSRSCARSAPKNYVGPGGPRHRSGHPDCPSVRVIFQTWLSPVRNA
jgi:hypothetical protein